MIEIRELTLAELDEIAGGFGDFDFDFSDVGIGQINFGVAFDNLNIGVGEVNIY
ncbi:MAG: hypothetical protein ACJ8AH_22445 [Stellaceae bacterium]